MRFSYQSGDDITALTQKITPNNIKIANFALNKWFTVKADYAYSSTGMTVKVSIIDTYTETALTSFTHETTVMNSGVRVGYGAATKGTEVYYDNFSVKYKVREDELDIDEVNKFLADYKDVFGFTGKLTDAQKQRLEEACATFFSLKKLTKEYLTEQGEIDKLISLASSFSDKEVGKFKTDHKEILSKTTDNITREDKLKLYAALKVYNGFNALQKMAVYKQGELLRALDEVVVERTGEYDCSPFYEDFERGLNKWKLDFTNSNQYEFETTTDSDNPSNTLLKSSGHSMFFIPTDKYWPAKGKMVKLSLRMKFDGFIPHNPPMVVYSYKDENNYYSASVKNDGYKSENLGFSGGIPIRSYELNKGEKLLDMSDWVNVEIDGVKGKRETSTMPGSAGSSWYFLRYIDPNNDKEFASMDAMKYWNRVDWYNGGMEHTARHLLYARFWVQFLYNIGLVPNKEMIWTRVSHGMVLGPDNQKMSKSKGNVINPDDIVKEFGADVLRIYEMFMGDYQMDAPWSTDSLRGCKRFVDKVVRLKDKLNDKEGFTESLEVLQNKTIMKIEYDMTHMGYNTAISSLMILVNAYDELETITKEDYRLLLQLLNPIAPHVTEELNEMIGYSPICESEWPVYDEAKTVENTKEIAVQVNGKVRATIEINIDDDEQSIKEKAMDAENVIKHIEGKEIVKVIVIKGKIVNIVVK